MHAMMHVLGDDCSVGRTVTNVSLAPVDSCQIASGTFASVFTRLGNPLLTVALSSMSMLLIALSSFASQN